MKRKRKSIDHTKKRGELTFGELLEWHLLNNTRSEPAPAWKRSWALSEFAKAVGVNPRTVRNWRNGQKQYPHAGNLESIERVLLDGSPAHETFRKELRDAYGRIPQLPWSPETYLSALGVSPALSARREELYESIWEKMEQPSKVLHLLLLFGGISEQLCNQAAEHRYLGWLAANPSAHLFFCFESGEAAELRGKALDPNELRKKGDLSNKPKRRMKQKELIVRRFQTRLELAATTRGVRNRIRFVPLRHHLNNYVIVTDDDIVLTPLLAKRASETFSFVLSTNLVQHRLDVYKTMINHLRSQEQLANSDELIRIIQRKSAEEAK